MVYLLKIVIFHGYVKSYCKNPDFDEQLAGFKDPPGMMAIRDPNINQNGTY